MRFAAGFFRPSNVAMIAIAIMIALAGCTEKKGGPIDPENPENPENPDNPNPPTPELSITPEVTESILFSAAGTEEYEYTVTTNQKTWDAVSDKEWCIVTKGDGVFTVTAQPVPEATDRTEATITVTAGEAEPILITAKQKTLLVLKGVDGPLKFSATAGEVYVITVISGDPSRGWGMFAPDYEDVSEGEWCKPEITKEGKLQVAVEPYSGLDKPRTATIRTFASLQLADPIVIDVVQAPLEVHVAGRATAPYQATQARYFVNGEVVWTSPTRSSAYSICSDGGDIYISGTEGNRNCYWKNPNASTSSGNTMNLPGGYTGEVSSMIRAENGDFYVAFSPKNTATGLYEAQYWKNGVNSGVTFAKDTYYSPRAFAVKDGDVYYAGLINNTTNIRVWKNNATTYTDYQNGSTAYISGLAVDDSGDVWAAGYSLGNPRYCYLWKNGQIKKSYSGFKYACGPVCADGKVYFTVREDAGSMGAPEYYEANKIRLITYDDSTGTDKYVYVDDRKMDNGSAEGLAAHNGEIYILTTEGRTTNGTRIMRPTVWRYSEEEGMKALWVDFGPVRDAIMFFGDAMALR